MTTPSGRRQFRIKSSTRRWPSSYSAWVPWRFFFQLMTYFMRPPVANERARREPPSTFATAKFGTEIDENNLVLLHHYTTTLSDSPDAGHRDQRRGHLQSRRNRLDPGVHPKGSAAMFRDPLFVLVAVACLAVVAVLMFGVGGFAARRRFQPETRQQDHAPAPAAAVRRGRADRRLRLFLATRGLSHGGLNRIYTRTGDAGETALGDGTRVAKHSLRVTAYGTVDEVNATLGLARLHAAGEIGRSPRAHPERPVRPRRRSLHARYRERRRREISAAAHGRGAGRSAGGRNRRDERQADAAAQLHPAGRRRARRASASLPHRLPPRRAAGGRTRHGRGGQSRAR